MSDIDPYDRSSSEILFGLLESRLKNDTEIEYYRYYSKLQSKVSHSQMLSRHYEDMIERYSAVLAKEYNVSLKNSVDNYKIKLQDETHYITVCEKLLSKLELTTPIENMLQRERKPDEIITLTYLNRELPNMPYNVYASRPSFFLSSNDISLIQEITKDSKTNEQTQKKSESKKEIDGIAIRAILFAILFILLGFALVLCPLLALN